MNGISYIILKASKLYVYYWNKKLSCLF